MKINECGARPMSIDDIKWGGVFRHENNYFIKIQASKETGNIVAIHLGYGVPYSKGYFGDEPVFYYPNATLNVK